MDDNVNSFYSNTEPLSSQQPRKPNYSRPTNIRNNNPQPGMKRALDLRNNAEYSYFDDNTSEDEDEVQRNTLAKNSTAEFASSEGLNIGTSTGPHALGNRRMGNTQPIINPSELLSTATDRSNRRTNTQALINPRYEREPLPTTPIRSTPLAPTSALSYPGQPSHGRKRRRIIQPPYPSSTNIPNISNDDATPTKQQSPPPPPPGMFGTQARSIRGGRSTPDMPNQLDLSAEEVIRQLQDVPGMLAGTLTELAQMFDDLAQKHNILEERITLLEEENRALRSPSLISRSLPARQQRTSARTGTSYQFIQEDPGRTSDDHRSARKPSLAGFRPLKPLKPFPPPRT
ncbi:uncharacterized protein SEPMUDRAFT_117628 [Sphaerulina musiva SO2202]|uniref:Uncharacterized protein n=1 Tax=Sphaerulina musiva (strain SO2202) TaxID=692275 RepID=N1QGP5_SPHMS|nr:uncharacterized protein SEPMUDRAFT_117628 [Sphaerulina musiva SO2202]EMF11649.1 hypothetical protein SEPMUDRAFT_117628 [Sphaerulina musiva SO2202]